MNFKKDLLLIDLETTGLDADRHEIIQLAAVLLDKKTLKEKKTFNSFIKPKAWKKRDPESMAVNKIGWDVLKDSDSLDEVLSEFHRLFPPKNVILSYYVGITDIVFLKAAYRKARKEYQFDYHTFNIWGLFYPYLAIKGLLDSRKYFAGFSLETMLKHFKLGIPESRHDALTDCRVEAELLRRVIKDLK